MKDARSYFYMPEGTYLNCSYMAPLLRDVEEAGFEAIRARREPAKISPDLFFAETEQVRHLLGAMIKAEPSRIVLIPSVSYGMANVTNNLSLSEGQHILLAGEQFPSNYYPWKRLADRYAAKIKSIYPDQEAESRGKSWNENILSGIDEHTAVVAISNVHWADGTRFDLKAIRQRTNEVGAKLIIDGTQSIGALPFDVSDIQPDALVCAGYKWLMGPYSLGFAYYGPYFDDGEPIEENWINRKNSEDFTGLINYENDYQPGALRYEVGEHSNFTLVPMFHTALKQVAQWTPEYIQEYCRSIIAAPVKRIRELGYRIDTEPYRASHVFGIRIPEKVDGVGLKKLLTDEKIILSFRGDAIRVAPNVYNSEEDLWKLVAVLERALQVAPLVQ